MRLPSLGGCQNVGCLKCERVLLAFPHVQTWDLDIIEDWNKSVHYAICSVAADCSSDLWRWYSRFIMLLHFSLEKRNFPVPVPLLSPSLRFLKSN